MPLLIDGYNVLYTVGIMGREIAPGRLHESRLAMLNFLADSLEAQDAARTTVVFDAQDPPWGLPRTTRYRGLCVRFAPQHQSADELIAELIAADSAPRQLTVVSSDHQVQRAAKRRRARAVDSDVWYRELLNARRQRETAEAVTPARPPVPLLEEDVNYWLRQFGGEAELREFLQRESTEATHSLPASDEPNDSASADAAEGRTPAAAPRAGKERKRAKPAQTGKAAKSTQKTPGKRRPRSKKEPGADKPVSRRAAANKRLPQDIERLDNPFPPGYGDDLLEQW